MNLLGQAEQAATDAKRMIEEHFGRVANLKSALCEDAGTDEPYIEISFDVCHEVRNFRRAYDAFTDEWVRVHPFKVREKIRFVFAIV